MNFHDTIKMICVALLCSILGVSDVFGMADETSELHSGAGDVEVVVQTPQESGGLDDDQDESSETDTEVQSDVEENKQAVQTVTTPVVLEEKTELVTIKTGDGYEATMPLTLFSPLANVNVIRKAQEAYGKNAENANAIENFFTSTKFGSPELFDTFQRGLELVNTEKLIALDHKKLMPRVFVQSIADNEISKLETPHEIENLLCIADKLGFTELQLACAMCLIKNHPEFVQEYIEEKSPGLFRDFIAREARFSGFQEHKVTAQDAQYLAEHGFLPTWASNFVDPENNVAQLWDTWAQDPRHSSFVAQLPQKIKEILALRMIEQNYKQPKFMISDWIIYVTPEQAKKVVYKLAIKAHQFVGDKTADKKELKARFNNLPTENAFTMAVRNVYHKIRGENIDAVQISKIFENFGKPEGVNVDWSNCDIESAEGSYNHIDKYQDLLLVWNHITPIKTLNLNSNQLSTMAVPAAFTTLEHLFIGTNRLTAITFIATMPALKTLYLPGNQLTTTPTFAMLPALVSLDLAGNGLATIPIPATLVTLNIIDLSGNELSDAEKASLRAQFPNASLTL